MILKRRYLKASVALASIALVLTFGFQNCSNTQLTKIEFSALENPAVDFKASFCSRADFSNGVNSKFVIIMDLSASNFGDWKKQTVGSKSVYYWDSTLATDPNGERFDAVKYFLENCGNQAGAQFAFIGFSKTAGILSGDTLTCANLKFETKDVVSAQIDAIKARQLQDERWYKQWAYPRYLSQTEPDSLVYSVTSYLSANKCLEQLMLDEFLTNVSTAADRYNVFFISDGVPQDKNGTGCNLSTMTADQKTSCYLETNLSSIAMTRTAAISKLKDVRIQGIYYGDSGGGVVPTVLEALSREGGTSEVVELENFTGKKNALCDLIVARNATEFRPDLYATINMTAYRKNGEIVADSDMDGLTDDEEVKLGYDPQNPRSSNVSGILDGICERLGGPTACQAKRSRITCDPNKLDLLGLSDCDTKILGLNTLPGALADTVDSDRDGMPDFVEVIKGTDPARADMTLDPDNDAIVTRDEILRGTDPFFKDNETPVFKLNQSSITFRPTSSVENALTCSAGTWDLSLGRLQYAETLPVTSFADSLATMKHPRNAQIVLVLHRLSAVNSTIPTIEFYGQYIRVSVSGKVGEELIEALPARLNAPDFQFLGKANP